MFVKLVHKFEGFGYVINGTFIDKISELLQFDTLSNEKGKIISEVDHAM